MAHILAIGIAALDIINLVAQYPREDTKVRALSQRRTRGGNATNTLVVLSQLGHHCSWGGVCVDEPDGQIILQDLAEHAIDTRYCRFETQGKVPTSYITVNQGNGSRTIVHHRDLPEFTYQDFQPIELSQFDWVHFEGRQVIETTQMLTRVRQQCPNLPISVEIETWRPNIEQLFTQAQILLFSRTFAHQYTNTHNPSGFLHQIRPLAPQATLICAWGEQGGYALTTNGLLLHSPAMSPVQIVDTIGAGDTFNAGIIDQLVCHRNLETALHYANQLAGKKCGQIGLMVNGEL
jgi:ketohexokinase